MRRDIIILVGNTFWDNVLISEINIDSPTNHKNQKMRHESHVYFGEQCFFFDLG